MTDLTNHSLLDTLVLALSQCKEQSRAIDAQTRRINELLTENEELKKELNTRNTSSLSDVPKNGANQAQDLFQKHVEAQAEIRKLKKKLKSYKEKAPLGASAPLSSPTSTPVTPVSSSPKQLHVEGNRPTSRLPSPGGLGVHREATTEYSFEHVNALSDQALSSPPRKRARFDVDEERDVFAELPTNIQPSFLIPAPAFQAYSTDKLRAGISSLAEDGENDTHRYQHSTSEQPMLSRDDSAHHRLDGLLTGSTPVKTPLARPRSRSPQPPNRTLQQNDARVSSISMNPWPLLNASSTVKKTVDDPPAIIDQGIDYVESNKRPRAHAHITEDCVPKRDSIERQFQSSKNAKKPLRSRPVNSLTFSSFKPNPRWLASHNVSYDDFLNDRQHECMRSLATTLPHLPGETFGHRSSGHDLLLEFLGLGSEEKIASLTPVARKNLLLEAKTRRVAQHFKFADRSAEQDKEDVPRGFWSTDMPGTQEAEENREAGRQRDRDEVQRRYDDAVSGNGRWVFADE